MYDITTIDVYSLNKCHAFMKSDVIVLACFFSRL